MSFKGFNTDSHMRKTEFFLRNLGIFNLLGSSRDILSRQPSVYIGVTSRKPLIIQ